MGQFLLFVEFSKHSFGTVDLSLKGFYRFAGLFHKLSDFHFIIIVVQSDLTVRFLQGTAAAVKPLLYFLLQTVPFWRIRGRKYRKVFVLRGNCPPSCPLDPVQAFVGCDFAEPGLGVSTVKQSHTLVGRKEGILGQILCVKIIFCIFVADRENQILILVNVFFQLFFRIDKTASFPSVPCTLLLMPFTDLERSRWGDYFKILKKCEIHGSACGRY
jgi:hypothetical protein